MTSRPFLRAFVAPATLCALAFVAALAAVMQYSLRAYVPGSLEPGGFTLANFAALMKPLYARVFLDTVWICFLTALFTLIVGYPLAYALVHARNVALDPQVQAEVAKFKKGSPVVLDAKLDPAIAKLPGVFTSVDQWNKQAIIIDHKLRAEKTAEWRKWFAENIMN